MTRFIKLSLTLLGVAIIMLSLLFAFYFVYKKDNANSIPIEASYVDSENEIIPKNSSYYGEEFLPFVGE